MAIVKYFTSCQVINQTAQLDGYFGTAWDVNAFPIKASFDGYYADLGRTITNWAPRSWYAITLPEQILIPRVRIYTSEVKPETLIKKTSIRLISYKVTFTRIFLHT